MPKGSSGRVVVEVDPDLKRRLYSALAIESSTLKDWFIDAAKQYVAEREQPLLPTIKTNNQKGAKRS
jgi:hypothetical protein